MNRRELVLTVLLLAVTPFAIATTWVDVEVTCPICGTTNIFQVPASYGSYVYQDPSRLQYVFWPATTDRFLYTCRECHFTAYMGEFEDVPEAKILDIASMLEEQAAIDGEVVPYYEIPMPTRLGIAEEVYEILGRDDAFWSEFHRIEAYHLEEAGREEAAKRARKQALELATRLLEDAPSARKETLFIIASMRFFTGDTEGARAAIAEAKDLTYASPEQGEEVSEQLDRYLGQLIADFEAELMGPRKLD